MERTQKKSFAWRTQTFVGELKRRKVFQVTSVYLVAAWGLSAGAADIFEVLDFPTWASRYFVIALFSMTPLVIVIAWVFELNRAGIQRDLGPSSPVDQTTVLALRKDLPRATATWQGTQHTFTQAFVVGRDDACAIQIVDPMVSRQHAKFECIKGRWQVTDLGSANGVVLNGQKVEQAWLEEDASIRFYPDGPALELKFSRPLTAETQMAKRPTS